MSVRDNIIKECREEAGLDAIVGRVAAIQDREKHNLPIYAYKICKVFAICTVIGGAFTQKNETVGSDYFSMENMPPLAEEKNDFEQIKMCFDAYHAEHWETIID